MLAALELSIVLILFLLRIRLFKVIYFSQGLLILNLSYAIILILMVATYALLLANYKKREALYVQSILFVLFVILFSASYVIHPSLSSTSLLETFSTIFSEYIYLPLFFFLVFLGSVGAYLIRIKNKPLVGYGIFILLFLILAVVLISALRIYYLDDETLLSFYGVQFLTQGINPYNTSISGTLYYLYRFANVSATMTTANHLASLMPYPSLYFLSSAPFYIFLPMTFYNLENIDLPVQMAALITLLVFAVLMGMRKEELLKPKLLLVVFLALLLSSITSITVFLMAVLLYLSYIGIKSKYAWLLIGLAVSLQQELWFPCLLLIIYSFNNYGTKKSIQTLIGAAIVFFAFNAYFIFLNPSAFINSVFLNPFAYSFPSIEAPIGYFLLSNYHILIGSLGTISKLVILFLIVVFASVNRKELSLLFSIIPYFFFSNSLDVYYSLPFLVFVAVLYSPQIKEGTGWFMKYLHSSAVARYTVCTALLAIFLLFILVLYTSHSTYTSNFNVSITNQSITTIGNATVYSADLNYRNVAVNYTYFGLYDLSGYNFQGYGFYDQQILTNNQSSCNSYNCTASMNKIPINGTAGTYRIRAVFKPYTNQSIGTVVGTVYNHNYFYISNPAYNNT